MLSYDIIIVGGGMVGASLACALRESALRIAIIDAAPPQSQEDHRLIALSHNSYCFLKKLNLWEALSATAEPIEQIHVSHRGHFGMLRLQANDVTLPVLGYVVPAKNINIALNQALSACPQIDIIRPAKLTQLIPDEPQSTLEIETTTGTTTLQGSLIIGADGTHSSVRSLLNIATDVTDYQQSAIVTITELQRPHRHIAYERFHQHGAIAMLPLTEQRVATIWTDSNTMIEHLMALDDSAFLQTLQQQFGYRLGRLRQIHSRHVYPLQMIKAQQTRKKNVVLVGNAAHTLSPLAAQGLNLALSEIAMLTKTITAQQHQLDTLNWESYLAWQQQQQSVSTRLSHHLPRLFSQDSWSLNLARQLGIIGLDICPPVKKRFLTKALGI